MCTSNSTKEQAQYKVLRYRNEMDEAVTWIDYEFYRDLWLIAKAQLRKYSRTIA